MTEKPEKSYRESHATAGYGAIYSETYRKGYYLHQWNYLERPLIEKIFQKQKKAGAISYLDFACGTGRILEVAERFFDVTFGVDVSEPMLDIARKKCPASLLIKADLTKEKVITQKLDLITAFRFFLNAEDKLRSEVLTTLYDLLNARGTLIANIHVNNTSILGYAYRIRNYILRQKIANTLGYKEFYEILTRHGFSVEEVFWYSFLPRTGWRFDWLAKNYMPFVEKVCNHTFFLPNKMAQSFIVVCKKM